jgi:hypothetical protein
MVEQEIPVRTPDGQMTTHVVHPEGDAPYPVAVVFMEEPGTGREPFSPPVPLSGAFVPGRMLTGSPRGGPSRSPGGASSPAAAL